MPKEMAHWYLAGRVRDALTQDSLFYDPVFEYENLFFLGAVTPDIPFYYSRGDGGKSINAAAARLHAADASALEPVLTFLRGVSTPPAMALAAGAVCHILSDTLFHPPVYYFAGMDDVHPGAVCRHRQFETALDIHVGFLAGKSGVSDLGRLVRKVEIPENRLLALMALLMDKKGQEKDLWRALACQRLYTALFRNYPVYRCFNGLNRSGMLPDDTLALFYPCKKPRFLPFFHHPMRYRHPLSGRFLQASTLDLACETVRKSKVLLDLISAALQKNNRLTELLDHPGLPEIRPGFDRCRYWYQKSDILPMLYPKPAFPPFK